MTYDRDQYLANREAKIDAAQRWRAENPDRARDAQRRRVYGLEQGEFDAILARQHGKCGICGTPIGDDMPDREVHLDHDHTSGAVRGILCRSCNLGLGFFRDDPERLANAILYLDGYVV